MTRKEEQKLFRPQHKLIRIFVGFRKLIMFILQPTYLQKCTVSNLFYNVEDSCESNRSYSTHSDLDSNQGLQHGRRAF